MAGLTPFLAMLVLACNGKPKPVETVPGTTETQPETTPNTVPTYACPPPPDDALTFSVGTVHAEHAFIDIDATDPVYSPLNEKAWDLVVSGLSYTHEKACVDLTAMNEYKLDIIEGRAPGQFWFEMGLQVPGSRIEDWIGVHPQGNGDMTRTATESNHTLTIGWRDADHTYPHFVSNLPHGWTASEVCIGQVRPDYIYLTVLWDPVDGPYRTNDWMPMDQPIWFDMEIWRSDGGDLNDPEGSRHRSCMALAWNFVPEEEPDDPISRYYADYTWPGKPDFDGRKPTLP